MAAPFLRSAFAVARADFRERRRHYSFFIGLLFTAFLCYQAASGHVLLTIDGARGVYNSAWVGMLMGLLANIFTLFAFYLVKNSVSRDEDTRVGQLLAATPLSNSGYVLAKLLSNCAVLASILGVFAAAAPVVQLWFGEDPTIEAWRLYAPLLLLSLPAMALTAVAAVCFELLPVLRSRVGNVIWFLLWAFSFPSPKPTSRTWLDFITGWWAVKEMARDAASRIPGYRGFAQFNIDVSAHVEVVKNWSWVGIHWTASAVLMQVSLVVLGFVLPLLLMALFFNRFDPAQESAWKIHAKSRPPAARARLAGWPEPQIQKGNDSQTGSAAHLTPMDRHAFSRGINQLFVAELRLAYSAYSWWWYAAAILLVLSQFIAPLTLARGPILATSWLWSVLTFSAMGTREIQHVTRVLIFSCANVLPQQLAACFFVGLLTAVLSGAGVALRLAFLGDSAGLFGWLAGTVLIPSLALGLGIVSGKSKLFEGLLALLWYATLNNVRGSDLTGTSNGGQRTHFAGLDLALALVCLMIAYSFRSAQCYELWDTLGSKLRSTVSAHQKT